VLYAAEAEPKDLRIVVQLPYHALVVSTMIPRINHVNLPRGQKKTNRPPESRHLGCPIDRTTPRRRAPWQAFMLASGFYLQKIFVHGIRDGVNLFYTRIKNGDVKGQIL
jgi:hypothetical protein